MWREAAEEMMTMPKGGHAHSGPPPDPTSRTSQRKGLVLTALPSGGYDGDVPDLSDFLIDPTPRHEQVWSGLWATPQANAWARDRWRWPVVADLAKWMVRSDVPEAPASVATTVRQLRDDLGLSTAGLRVNGWAIAADEVGAKATEHKSTPRPQRRLRSVDAQ